MQRSVILFVLLGACWAAAFAEPVWRWVDEDGVVHYTDRPVEGAERIELKPPPVVEVARPPQRRDREDEAEAQAVVYDRLAIADPTQEEVLWNIGGTLDVTLELRPRLQAGHGVEIVLDGSVREDLPDDSLSFEIPEVWRGTHTIQARVVDEDGRVLIASPIVTFFVQQTSILNPNNPTPPANRPRPQR
jgi:hypothetical protein